jgi:hypothetical protein
VFRYVAIVLGIALGSLHAGAVLSQSAEPATTLLLSGADWRIHEDADGQGAERQMFQADASAAD